MVGVSSDLFVSLGIIIIITAIAAFILRLIKQPQILAYVLVGILITPVFKIVNNSSMIESMSTIGIAFLLFLVGLEMDIKGLKNVAFNSTFGGLIQMLILFILGYLISILLGFLSLQAAYIGLMLCFSSTMVVMKLLSDKRELNTLHGRVITGILLLEDIVAIFALSILTSINGFSFPMFGLAVIKFISLFAIAFLASKYFFPPLFRVGAKFQELLLLLSLAVCFSFSLAFYYLGFSIAIGAFIAGVALGNLEYNLEIISKMKNLRDFFSMLFFVSLGMGLSLSVVKKEWLLLLVLLFLIIIVKPFLIMVISSLFKYTKKPAFLMATSLAQMGEFSLILAAQGLLLGHITQDLFSVVVIITLITITLTSYFIQYDQWLYNFLQGPLSFFNIFTTKNLENKPTKVSSKYVLCGHNRIGYSILKNLQSVKSKVLIVDYNPEVISDLTKEGYHCIYGDVADEEIMDRMNLRKIILLISTVPELNDNFMLIRRLKTVNKKAKVMVTANTVEEAMKLYQHGADYVIMPHFLGGEHVAQIITGVRNKKIKLSEEKEKHLTHLMERKKMHQEHPSNG